MTVPVRPSFAVGDLEWDTALDMMNEVDAPQRGNFLGVLQGFIYRVRPTSPPMIPRWVADLMKIVVAVPSTALTFDWRPADWVVVFDIIAERETAEERLECAAAVGAVLLLGGDPRPCVGLPVRPHATPSAPYDKRAALPLPTSAKRPRKSRA